MIVPEFMKEFFAELSSEDKESVADWLETSDSEEVLDDIIQIVAK